MNKHLRALLARKEKAVAAAQALMTVAADAGRDLSAEEQSSFDAHMADVTSLNAQIERVNALIEAERSAPVTGTALELPDTAQIGAVVDRVANDPTAGFAHFGQYLAAVRTASVRPQATDQRLQILGAAASTYANESVGADGGFLVPPTYAAEILSVIESQESLLSRVRQVPVSGNSFVIPANEVTAHGSTGVQAYWDSEADTISQSKPAFSNREVKLNRITALCPITEEALEDAPALGSWLQMEAGEKMTFKVSDAILNGTGVGMPLGVMKSPALVTVSKEGSQAADTILAANVLKMYSRMPARNRANAVWLMNQDLEPQLPQMSVAVKNVAGTENVGGFPVYMPPGGLTGSQYGVLLGRPIVMIESAAAIGDLGDVVLSDLSQYIAITKGGVKSEQSMHFWFDQNLRAFRFVYRIGGMPWLSAPIGRKNGSNTLSHFVTLEAR